MKYTIIGNKNKSILELLREQGVVLRNDCGGNGRCGKCAVKLDEGWRLSCKVIPEQGSCLEVFVSEDTFQGMKVQVESSIEEEHSTPEGKGNKLEDEYSNLKKEHKFLPPNKSQSEPPHSESPIGIAVDIGTTSVVMQLITNTSTSLQTLAFANPQRAYGADVISRIQASMNEPKQCHQLKRLIWDAIEKGAEQLVRQWKQETGKEIGKETGKEVGKEIGKEIDKEALTSLYAQDSAWSHLSMVCAMNTTMLHLMMGYDVSGLAAHPFTPYRTKAVWLEDKNIWTMPCASAFIGGDIIAGLLALSYDQQTKPSLFLDLGTNAEMVVGCGQTLWSASAAAGPAFEGGQMEYGVPGIPGAICQVFVRQGSLGCRTIDNLPPVGICGSAYIDAASCLLELGWMDETGLLADEYLENGIDLASYWVSEESDGKYWVSEESDGKVTGKDRSDVDGKSSDQERKKHRSQSPAENISHQLKPVPAKRIPIRITQKDLRELQLAKAAICAGIETLLKVSEISMEGLQSLHLAGGFGQKIDVEHAANIGLIPASMKMIAKPVGNTSLAGARSILQHQTGKERAQKLCESIREVSLAAENYFTEAYVEGMYFQSRSREL